MQSTTSKVVLLVVLVAAAIGLFVVLSGDDDDSGSSTATETTQSTTATTATEPPAPTASITIENRVPVGGIAEIDVTKGDEVTIEVSSDVDSEVHVHGYEIEKPVKAGGTVRVKFTADIDGKFEIEQHFESGEPHEAEIAELTVQPS